MAESTTEILTRFFQRARDDVDASLLADDFASAYDSGAWNAKALEGAIERAVEAQSRGTA